MLRYVFLALALLATVIYVALFGVVLAGELAIDASRGDSGFNMIANTGKLLYAAGLPPWLLAMYFWVRCDRFADWMRGVIWVACTLVLHVFVCFVLAHGALVWQVAVCIAESGLVGLVVFLHERRRLRLWWQQSSLESGQP